MKIYIVNEKQYCCDGMYHDDIDDNALIKIIRLLLGFASDLSSSTKMSSNSEKAMLSTLISPKLTKSTRKTENFSLNIFHENCFHFST